MSKKENGIGVQFLAKKVKLLVLLFIVASKGLYNYMKANKKSFLYSFWTVSSVLNLQKETRSPGKANSSWFWRHRTFEVNRRTFKNLIPEMSGQKSLQNKFLQQLQRQSNSSSGRAQTAALRMTYGVWLLGKVTVIILFLWMRLWRQMTSSRPLRKAELLNQGGKPQQLQRLNVVLLGPSLISSA